MGELTWGAADVLLEVFGKEGGIGKVEKVAYLLYRVVTTEQHGLCVKNNHVTNPVCRVASADLQDNLAEVFGRQMRQVGIVGHGTVNLVVLLDVTKEVLKHVLVAAVTF